MSRKVIHGENSISLRLTPILKLLIQEVIITLLLFHGIYILSMTSVNNLGIVSILYFSIIFVHIVVC